MIKIYFDWNVLSQLKNGKHPELKEILKNEKKLLIPFSTAHIDDLNTNYDKTKKQNSYINSDLEFISSITNDYCLFNNGEKIILDLYSPKELFKQNISDKEEFNDISIDGLMKSFEEDELLQSIIKQMFDILKPLPIEESFKKAFDNPESSEMMNRFFPGLKENSTMEGFFKSFSEMNSKLNESDDYKVLRKTVQNSLNINRDKIFDTKSPFDFIRKNYEKFDFSINQLKQEYNQNPKWFDNITEEYIRLDLHGYQEDNINISKGRKQTFKNTINDSFHSAFASTCNFYVINDNRSYKKTKKVYEKLNINTVVFKPDEFIEHYKKFINNNNLALDIKIIFDIINSNNYYESKTKEGVYRNYHLPYFFFGFFNKIVSFYSNDEPDENTIFLSQDKPTNWFIIPKEVDKLLERLLIFFGDDINNEGKLKSNEFNIERWNGRKWKLKEVTLRLQSINGFVQLYFDRD